MTFHTGGDFACYFGLDADNNSLSVGGWSMGANKYKIWHSGNGGAGSGLDADKLDDQQGSYYLDYSNFTNRPTIPTNNTQLSNGRGYQTEAEVNTLISAQITIPSSLKVGNDTMDPQAYSSPDKQLQVGNTAIFNDYGIKVTRDSDSDYILLGLSGTSQKYSLYADGTTLISLDTSNYSKGIRIDPENSSFNNTSSIIVHGTGTTDLSFGTYDGSTEKWKFSTNHDGRTNFDLDSTNWQSGVYIDPTNSQANGASNILIYGTGTTDTTIQVYDGTDGVKKSTFNVSHKGNINLNICPQQ